METARSQPCQENQGQINNWGKLSKKNVGKTGGKEKAREEDLKENICTYKSQLIDNLGRSLSKTVAKPLGKQASFRLNSRSGESLFTRNTQMKECRTVFGFHKDEINENQESLGKTS